MKPQGAASKGYEIRELTAADLGNGFIETLGNLSDTGGLTPASARRILERLERASLYHVFVAAGADGKVVGATTLLVEQKFIHGGGLVGHIEDVAVRRGSEGRGIGGSLVKAAVRMADELGCYKVILDCKEEVEPFYAKLGFRKNDLGMRLDLTPGGQKAPKGTTRARVSTRS
jgi:glucosamine-phosphate N-acetyltransferase